MTLPKKDTMKLLVKQLAASVLAVCSIGALAQDPNLDISPPMPGIAPAPGDLLSGPSHLRSAGQTHSATWYSAVKFTGRLLSTAPALTYASNHFYNSPGTSGTQRYFAQLDLEPGVVVDAFTCVVNDASAANNVTVSWQKYTTNLGTLVSTPETLASNSSTGSGGIQFFFLVPGAAETISTTDGVLRLTQYHIAADVSGDTSFAGCWAWWTRQISPAPATASFSDVPTSHFAFQAIEALKASTVTTGCTASTYCPNNNVTRAEMALFLSRALGFSWRF